MEEDEDKTERAQFPKVLSEYTSFIGKDKSIHAWMAELLWDCGYEEQDRRTKLMAISPYSNVHMETMEVTQNKEKKPYKRSEEHTSELQSPLIISYAVFCLKKKKQ